MRDSLSLGLMTPSKKATYQVAEIITSEERWEQILENGSLLIGRLAPPVVPNPTLRIVCSTAEQEVVATWPIRPAQLLNHIPSL